MEPINQKEIIYQLSELVAKLRAENTMSSDAGPFQAPPPSGGAPQSNNITKKTPPHIVRVIRLRLHSIKENPPAA